MAGEPKFDGSDLSIAVNRDPSGGMMSDVDVLEIKNGAYYDKVNVERSVDGKWLSDVGSPGNSIAVQIPDQGLQNQKVRIYIDRFFSSGKIQVFNNHNQLVYGTKFAATTTLQGVKQALITRITEFPITTSFQYGPPSTLPYLDVELGFHYSDYTLVVTGQDNTTYTTAILQEAICATGAGEFVETGSRQQNGVLFRTHSTQAKMLEKGKNILSVQVYQGRVVIMLQEHGVQNFESIVLSNLTGTAAAFNGVWVADVLSTDFIALWHSVPGTLPFAPTYYGGYIYKNPYGLGAITVQQYVPNSDTYTITVVAKAKKLNLYQQKQVDIDIDYFNGQYSAYFTDFFNPQRAMYFIGDIKEQMVIKALNPDGIYAFDTMGEEIVCEVNSRKFTITNLPQEQAGGAVPSGTWRYTVYLKTEGLAATEVGPLAERIPVYAPAYKDSGYQVYGSTGTTSKINRIQVDGLTPGVYKYIVLIGVFYAGADNNAVATTAFEIREEQLGPDQTSIVLEHNGNETDIRTFDIRKLNLTREDALRVGCNVIGENYLFRGNIVTTRTIDIREWVAKMKYSIKRFNLYGSYGAETISEFYDPEASALTGYQQYEWYRFYIAAKSKITGTITDATFAFDVRFLSKADYDPNEFIATNVTDRRDMNGDDFDDYDLGDDQRNFYQYYLRLKGIDWDFQIEGIPAKDLFSEVYVCRCERVKEVIADGSVITSVYSNTNIDDENPTYYNVEFYNFNNGPFPSVNDNGTITFDPVHNNIMAFYSPDLLFGVNNIGPATNGDELLVFGTQQQSQVQSGLTILADIPSYWIIYWGKTSVTSPTKYAVEATGYVDTGLTGVIGGMRFSKDPRYGTSLSGVTATGGEVQGSYVIKTTVDVVNNSPYLDDRKYRALYFRRLKDKYGSITSSGSNVVFTNAVAKVGEREVNVFGGDVYTQQTWVKDKYPTYGSLSTNKGGAIGFNIISQNGINTNLRVFDPDSTTSWLFPQKSPEYLLWLGMQYNVAPDQIIKNSAYQAVTQSQFLYVYNPAEVARNLKPSRIQYSDLKPNGSQTDFFRTWPPLNFRDNPLNFGAIMRLDFANGELFTLQERNYTREFVSGSGRLGTLESGTVIIGDGSVLDRKGLHLTVMGSRHPWSYARGYTEAGTDVRYWINDEYDALMRKGPDGTVNVTERCQMSLWFRERLRFIKGKTNPASGQGVHCVWDHIGKNLLITVRGWKNSSQWNSLSKYEATQTVLNGEQYGVPIMYECLATNPGGSGTEPGTPGGEPYWRKVDFSETDFYSLFTIVFNEKYNRFQERYTFYPKIYSVHNNRYFSPNPKTGEQGKIYLYRKGEPIVYFEEEHEGFMQSIINYSPSIVKKFIALAYTSLRNPIKVKVESQFISSAGIDNRVTEMYRDVPRDMNYRENQSYVTIKNSFNAEGRTDRRSPQIKGLYAIITTYFKAREEQKINDIHVGVRLPQRNNQNP